MWRGISARVVLATLLLGTACTSRKPLPFPDLPVIRMENFEPAILDQMRKAYAAVQSNPFDGEANGRLGMVLDAYEQHRLAEICYQRARALDPVSFRWTYYLGAVLTAQAKNAEAVEAWRDAARLKPDYLPARIQFAESLFAAGDHRGSRR